MNKKAALLTTILTAFAVQAKAEIGDRIEAYNISKEAYIYAFPMIAGYKAFYEFNVDKASSQYKGAAQYHHQRRQCFHLQRYGDRDAEQRYPVFDDAGGFARRADGLLRSGH